MMYEVDDSLIRALIFERGLTVASQTPQKWRESQRADYSCAR